MDGYDYYQQSYEYDNSSSYFPHHQNEQHRFLAPDGLRVPTVDYAVISVVVITLALVLFIEVMRHQLDVAASGNPFFQHVLELMYRECTLYVCCLHLHCNECMVYCCSLTDIFIHPLCLYSDNSGHSVSIANRHMS